MENVIVFDPSLEELRMVVEETSKITADDLFDDVQMTLVHETRIKLRDIRVRIEKTGKTLRQSALDYQRNIISREKELLFVVSGEESRLKAIEENATATRERAARVALLPMRQEMLAKFGAPTLSDEAILDMDNDAFMVYLNERHAQKNENDRLEIEAEKARLAHEATLAQVAEDARVAERNRIEAEAKADELNRIEKAAQEKRDAEIAAQKLIDDAKAEADRVVAQAKAQEEARLREIEVREQQAKAEAVKAEAASLFTEWKLNHGWTEETDDQYKTVHVDGAIELWKIVGVY